MSKEKIRTEIKDIKDACSSISARACNIETQLNRAGTINPVDLSDCKYYKNRVDDAVKNIYDILKGVKNDN